MPMGASSGAVFVHFDFVLNFCCLERRHRKTARHCFKKVENPDPNNFHNASKLCSRQQTSTKKAEKPSSPKTHK